MTPGIYEDISNHDYHNGEGVSTSDLKLVLKSPLHLKVKKAAANDNKPQSDAFFIGTAFHALLLEPEEFTKNYCLGLRQSDFPDAIEGRDKLVAMAEKLNAEREAIIVSAKAVNGADELKAMIAKLNEGRLPKLPTTGSKDQQLARINEVRSAAAAPGEIVTLLDKSAKGDELKAAIEEINAARPGLLSTSGSVAELSATLRANGVEFTTRQEMLDEWQKMHGAPMFINVQLPIHGLADALRNAGAKFDLWADVQAVWLQNNGHRIVLTPPQWDQLHRMREAVYAHPMGARLISMQGKAENSVYWIDAETGELCRCRPDWWPEPFIVDLKTTDDASPEGFARSIATYGYDVQDAFYSDGMAAAGRPLRAFLFLAVQKDAHVIDGQSFGVGVYQLDPASRELGRAKYRQALKTYAECKRTGIWPNYGEQINPISLPQWNFAANAHLVTEGVA